MISDSHRLFCEGLKCLLEKNDDINVSCVAHSFNESLDGFRYSIVDIVILDLENDNDDGINLLSFIKKKNIPVKVIILTDCDDISLYIKADEYNVNGYLLKNILCEELIKAINDVNLGKRYIQSSILPSINNYLINKDLDRDKLNSLTNRELEILKMISIGGKNIDIANKMNISERTVKNHLSHIFDKIGVSDRTQAAVFAIKNNIVSIVNK